MNPSKNQTPLTDEEIISLYFARNEEAISATDYKYRSYLFTIAYNIIHDRLDCEECLNDTYLGTWNAIPPTRPNIFSAFLAKIMRNTAVDKFREKNASRRIPSEMTVALQELNEDVAVQEDDSFGALGRILSDYLRSLSDRFAFIFICRYYYADRVEDIAGMLRMSKSSIYRDLAKIRENLQKKLNEGGYHYGE